MPQSHNEFDSVLEILDGGSRAEWLVIPGTPADLPISIRNGTQESHDIEVTIADPIDWARVAPARIALGPGDEAKTTLMVTIPADAQVAAGEHNVTLELHDFEGTCFGQLISSVNIQPVYRLELAAQVGEPLIRRNIVEGFTLHCTLVNHGNSECAVELREDSGACVSLRAPPVRVPMGGQISFDVEARWTSAALSAYPVTIGVRAVYPNGEARANVPWDDILKCLGSYIPPLRQEDEFPEILPWRSTPLQVDAIPSIATPGEVNEAHTATILDVPSHAPIRVQINGPSPYKSAYGRRINPWWPPTERLGRRWRVKMLPLVAAFLLIATVGLLNFVRPAETSSLTPFTNLASAFHLPRQSTLLRKPRSIVAITRANTRVVRHAKSPAPDADGALPRLPSLPQVALTPSISQPHPTHASPPRQVINPKGSAWQGPVVHVSTTNIKVYSTVARAVRSFIVSPGFKSVYSDDGSHTYPMSDVRVGAIVRVFYSYTFGIRHPNSIFIVHQAR